METKPINFSYQIESKKTKKEITVTGIYFLSDFNGITKTNPGILYLMVRIFSHDIPRITFLINEDKKIDEIYIKKEVKQIINDLRNDEFL